MRYDAYAKNLWFKKLCEDAVLPSYAHPGDNGLDLIAVSKSFDLTSSIVTFGTGLAVAIPDFYVGLLFARSSVCNTGLRLSNSVGVIDSSYRGEIMVKFDVASWNMHQYAVGSKVAQLVVVPAPAMVPGFVNYLSETERAAAGFGSTGG